MIYFRVFTACWLFYEAYVYYLTSYRPIELFHPENYFGRLFMPSFPSYFQYSLVWLFAFVSNLWLLLKKNSTVQALLFVLLLWINCIQWSWGFQSNVGHIVILSHFFLIFSLFDQNSEESISQIQYKIIQWFYVGIFATYTLAGLWKLAGTAYKILYKPLEMNWLSADAAHMNAAVGYWQIDIPTNNLFTLYEIPYLWQILFVFALLAQLFSVLGAWKLKYIFISGLALCIFHLHNAFFVKIEFWASPIALLILTFPYHILKNLLHKQKAQF